MMPEYYKIFLSFEDLPELQADVMQKWTRSKYRKMWRERVYWAVRQAGGPPPKPLDCAGLYCKRYSSQLPDRANLAYSFKPLVDALLKGKKKANVLVDDNPSILIVEEYVWIPRPVGQGKITIEIVQWPDLAKAVAIHASLISHP